MTDLMSKHRVGRQSAKIQAAKVALDRFIEALESTPMPTSIADPGSNEEDYLSAAPLVDEATKKRKEGSSQAEYYAELRRITELCGYRLFIDTTTLGRNRELFIVSPPGNSQERIVSTQDAGEVVDWLRKQKRHEE